MMGFLPGPPLLKWLRFSYNLSSGSSTSSSGPVTPGSDDSVEDWRCGAEPYPELDPLERVEDCLMNGEVVVLFCVGEFT